MSFFNRVCRAVACGLLVTVTLGRTAVGASITFSAPVAITSDSILDQPGTVVQAGLFGTAPLSVTTPASTTINFPITPGSATQTASGSTTQIFGTFTPYQAPNSAIFDNSGSIISPQFAAVLDSFAFGPTLANAYGTLRLGGLTIGKSYTVQLLSADDRGGGQSVQFADSFANTLLTNPTALPAGNTSAIFHPSTNPSIIGSFTADSTIQDIYVFGIASGAAVGDPGSSNGFAQTLNAFVLRQQPAPVPEPSTGVFLFLGGLVLAGFGVRQRQARSGWAATNCSHAEA